jgi:hypothetical protein
MDTDTTHILRETRGLPVYDPDRLTLDLIDDLADGRALVPNDFDPDLDTDSLELDSQEAEDYAAAKRCGWLELTYPRDGWLTYAPPYKIWSYYCYLTKRPIACLFVDPRRPEAGRTVSRARLLHVAFVDLGPTGEYLTDEAKTRLKRWIGPYRHHGRRAVRRGLADLVFFVRDTRLDEFKPLMNQLVDMAQELAVSR